MYVCMDMLVVESKKCGCFCRWIDIRRWRGREKIKQLTRMKFELQVKAGCEAILLMLWPCFRFLFLDLYLCWDNIFYFYTFNPLYCFMFVFCFTCRKKVLQLSCLRQWEELLIRLSPLWSWLRFFCCRLRCYIMFSATFLTNNFFDIYGLSTCVDENHRSPSTYIHWIHRYNRYLGTPRRRASSVRSLLIFINN